MRKNLIPLLAVALVIAGLCTVIFYGLIADRFAPAPQGAQAASIQLVAAARNVARGKTLEGADLKIVEGTCPVKTQGACFQTVAELLGRPAIEAIVEGQPLTDEVVAKRRAGASPSAVVPVGMRAVTLHAADSRGVVEMIRSGDRVDLQVIGSREPQAPLAVQRVWTNVEVLSTAPPDPGSSHTGRPVLTVLMAPAEAERLSLADTTSRIRVVLRNRQESARTAGGDAAAAQAAPIAAAPVAAASVAAASGASPGKAPVAVPAVAASPNAIPSTEPSFLVRLVSIQPEKLAGWGGGSDIQPQVRTMVRRELEDRLAQLEVEKSAQVLGSRPVTLNGQREALLALGADGQKVASLGAGRAGVRLRMRGLSGGRWRVEPEAQTSEPEAQTNETKAAAGRAGATSGAAARRSEAEATLDPQQAWLVSGLLEHKGGRTVLAGQGGENEPKLVLLVTPIPR